jgi:hypothetical protein
MKNKDKTIALLEAKIEKLTGKKIVYKEKVNCSCKSTLTEAKKEEKTSKEKESKETKAATSNANEPILGNIIPTSVIKEIEDYVNNTLAEIDKATTQLRAIKKQIATGATASNEDFSVLTERISFLVKQLSRLAAFTNNTIKAEKFDKTILNKIFDQKSL